MLAESLLAWFPPEEENEADARLAAYRVAMAINELTAPAKGRK